MQRFKQTKGGLFWKTLTLSFNLVLLSDTIFSDCKPQKFFLASFLNNALKVLDELKSCYFSCLSDDTFAL